jgi:hypothetical protein
MSSWSFLSKGGTTFILASRRLHHIPMLAGCLDLHFCSSVPVQKAVGTMLWNNHAENLRKFVKWKFKKRTMRERTVSWRFNAKIMIKGLQMKIRKHERAKWMKFLWGISIFCQRIPSIVSPYFTVLCRMDDSNMHEIAKQNSMVDHPSEHPFRRKALIRPEWCAFVLMPAEVPMSKPHLVSLHIARTSDFCHFLQSWMIIWFPEIELVIIGSLGAWDQLSRLLIDLGKNVEAENENEWCDIKWYNCNFPEIQHGQNLYNAPLDWNKLK